MDRLTRYVLRQSLMVALSVAVVFSAAVWLLQSLRLIDLIVNRGLSVSLFLYLAVLILPRFIDVVLPIAVFTAVLFVYCKLIAESELVVMRASGMSQWALAKPALMVGLAGTVTLYALSFYFLPTANRAFKDLEFQIRNKYASVLIQEGVFNTLSDTLMIYIKGRDTNGDLTSLLIQDSNDRNKPVTIFAERGAIVDTSEGPHIVLDNGIRQQYELETGKLSSLSFEKYTLDLSGIKGDVETRDRQPGELYINELLRRKNGARNPALIVELNMRLAGPLAALAMAALPVLCLLPGDFNRRGQSRRILLAIVLALALEIVDVGFKNLAGRSDLVIPLLYANVLSPLVAAWWLLGRSGKGARWRTSAKPAQ
jgi:lipopolysaccharide export system permease protein